jgi:hypothetical protein
MLQKYWDNEFSEFSSEVLWDGRNTSTLLMPRPPAKRSATCLELVRYQLARYQLVRYQPRLADSAHS